MSQIPAIRELSVWSVPEPQQKGAHTVAGGRGGRGTTSGRDGRGGKGDGRGDGRGSDVHISTGDPTSITIVQGSYRYKYSEDSDRQLPQKVAHTVAGIVVYIIYTNYTHYTHCTHYTH